MDSHETVKNRQKKLTKVDILYMQLELRKIFQNHHMFPTTFVFPIEGYVYSGISGVCGTKFKLMKSEMTETWKIQIENSSIQDTECCSMADVLLKYFGDRSV